MDKDTTNNTTPPHGDSSAVLKILEEKDKIIVSLKESSTKRDILNENQIRVLSEDNEKKKAALSAQNEQFLTLEKKFLDASSKLSVYQDRFQQYNEKLEDLKSSVNDYKQSIANSLQEVSDLVSLELSKRDEKSEKLSGVLQENYKKLEEKLSQVDSQYKTIINNIAQKQVKAKSYIRQALNVLQEALNLLDINSTGIMVDNKLFDDFQGIIQDSSHLFSELSSNTRDAATVVKNIENVNIKLSTTPNLDGFLKEMKQLSGGPIEVQTGKQTAEQVSIPSSGSEKSGGTTIEEDELEQMFAEDLMGTPPAPTSPTSGTAPSPPSSGISSPNTGTTPSGGPASAQSSITTPPPSSSGGENIPPTTTQAMHQTQGGPTQNFPTMNSYGSSAMGSFYSQGFTSDGIGTQQPTAAIAPSTQPSYGGAATATLAPPQTQTIKPEDDLVMRESPNLAPYNWDMLPSISPLLRFRRLLNNARRAEKRRNYVKALDIYEVIKQQRTVQDHPLSLNILEDQIEAINRIARAQVSINRKRQEVTKFIHLREENHDS